ncbi:MAG TPA: hypothetical protein VJ851_04130 [Jatrophihabitans sp.]|nr:hypothetical protein [Jatrophihabitans sp.]
MSSSSFGPSNGRADFDWPRLFRALSDPDSVDPAEPIVQQAVLLGHQVSPAIVGCSVTEVALDGFETAAASTELALALDLDQYRAGTGPCISAAQTGLHRYVDMTVEEQFREFVRAALERGVQCSFSVPLPGTARRSALNFYADQPDVLLDQRPRQVATLLSRCVARLLPASAAEPPNPAEAEARASGNLVRAAVDQLAQRQHRSARDVYQRLIHRSMDTGRPLSAIIADDPDAERVAR